MIKMRLKNAVWLHVLKKDGTEPDDKDKLMFVVVNIIALTHSFINEVGIVCSPHVDLLASFIIFSSSLWIVGTKSGDIVTVVLRT